MQDEQNISQYVRMVEKGIELSSKVIEDVTDAILRYLESRSFANREAGILADYIKHGGQASSITMNYNDGKELQRILQAEKIPSVMFKFKTEKGEEKYGLVFRKEDEAKVSQIREWYLASKNKINQLSMENLSKFTKADSFHEYSGLQYGEMEKMRERLEKNQVLFSVAKDGKAGYTIYTRQEDKDITELLRSGVQQERDGAGKKIYEQMDYDRQKRQDAVNKVLAEKDSSFRLSSHSGKVTLYVDKNGLWYEQEGRQREFIPREDERFQQKLCQYVDRMKCPEIIKGEMSKEDAAMFKQRFQNKETKEKVMKMEEAMKVYGFTKRKDLEQCQELKKPDEMLREKPNMNRSELEAAYCRMRNAVDFAHTKINADRTFYTEAERTAYEAESQIRQEAEYCINRGYDGKGVQAELYKSMQLDLDKMPGMSEEIQKEMHFTVDDMIRRVVWRGEREEMPGYIDGDGDGILKDHDVDEREFGDMEKETFEKEDFGSR